MKQNQIVFSKTIDEVAEEYHPQPASKFIPEWYKNIESYIPQKKNPDSTVTIKKCIPVLDSMTAGYVIVSPCDVYVSIKDGEPFYNSTINSMIQFHPRKQAYSHPMANEFTYPKWINPWAIKTPKGWSCYFKPLAHNPNPWFQILEGFVDTDTYNSPINFPFVLKDPYKECLIPAGTPIAQIIPVKRESWKMKIDEIPEADSVKKMINSKFFDRYKKMYWEKKQYL